MIESAGGRPGNSLPDIRPIALAAIVVIVPLWLIATKREELLIKWICLTIAVDIFDPRLMVNLPAARVAGLLLLPSCLEVLPAVRKSIAGNALWRYIIYMAIMGVIFGIMFPWSSEGFDRLPTQTSQLKAIAYVFRRAGEFSLGISIARYLWKTRRPDRLIEWCVYGSSIAATGGILEWLTHWDMYSAITGAEVLRLSDRVQGFSYEPRGLALIVGQGLLLAILLYARQQSKRWLGFIVLHFVALFLAVSTSGLFVVGVGLAALFIVDAQSRKILVSPSVIALLLCSSLLLVSVGTNFVASWSENVGLRLSGATGRSAPESLIAEFALRQDIFDASAIMLFAARPEFIFTGVGPGMAGLASTDYVPSAPLFDWVEERGEGLNSVPHVGLLRELCDVGLIGLFLAWIFVHASGRALSQLSAGSGLEAESWQIARAAFWVAVAIYLVQASPLSASFSVFMGIGLTATWLAPASESATQSITPLSA